MIEAALHGRPRTIQQFYDASNGRWDAERRGRQRELLDQLWARRSPDARSDSIAMIAGGMAGAGKKRVLDNPAVINRAEYCTIDPDEIKKEMAALEMIPAIDGLSPMEASPLVHEEASYLAKQLAHSAYREHINVLWDITMNRPESVTDRISTMSKFGYSRVDSVFVDVPFDTGRRRAMDRYRKDQEKYRNGEGPGGRYVPREFIEASRPSVGSETTRNHEVFLQVRDQFDSTKEYDNSESIARLRGATGPGWM
jgi:hypothetical protein